MSEREATEDPSRPLRILHLAASERWTGVAEPVISLAVEQQARGHRVWVGCVPGRSFERKTRERGVETLEGIHLNRRLNPFHLLADWRLLRRFCREQRVDIVHCHLLHDHWTAAVALRAFGGIGNRPLIVRTLHSSIPPRTDFLHRRLHVRYTDQLICISREAAAKVESEMGLAAESLPWVHGAVDTEAFHPDGDGSRLRGEFGIPADAPVAGIVARMRAGRGHRWLLRAIPEVLERVPGAHFVLVGRGELKRWIRQEIASEAYRGRVHYTGYRKLQMPDPDHATLPESYAAMDVSLFLGLGSEGTCRAILEAMASGVPVIGAETGAVPEIIDDGETGHLVRLRDIEDLADKLVESLSDRARAKAMGEAAREAVLQGFTQERRADAVEAIYRSVLASRDTAHPVSS